MKKPKVICLMPVKNEADILPITLKIISEYCDTIIIADQMSNDGSREIYKNFPKVRVINNPRNGHSNQVRWDLLNEARKIEGEKLILCLDADEYIPIKIFHKFLNATDFNIGDSFRFPWIQLWKSVDYYNNNGPWFRNYQRAAWVDDGQTNYNDEIIINDHISRVPKAFLKNCKRIDNTPIIHLQWVSWKKTQLKQALYKCTELIKNPNNYLSINSSYNHSLGNSKEKLIHTPEEWLENKEKLSSLENLGAGWHLNEILSLFNKHGVEFFEPLEIWHIEALKNEFKARTNREPVSRNDLKIISTVHDIIQFLKKMIKY